MSKPIAFVIEDNQDQAFTFKIATEQAGFETEVIEDGAIARQRLNDIAPQLIVLDLHLPNVSGDELLKQIRSDVRLEGARVFLATADAILAESLRGNNELVLIKPISFDQLRKLAARFLPEELVQN